MQTKTIRQSIKFKGSVHEVYETLMDSKKHSKITGSDAKISRKIGEGFSVYDGDIEGINLKLITDKKIVQSWRYSNWPKDHYSTITFSFKEIPDGTHLTFTQTGVPEEFYEDIRQGWRDYYWEPIKEMFKR